LSPNRKMPLVLQVETGYRI